MVTSAIGTWWERQNPSVFSPSTVLGPVHPFGLRSTIIGQTGRPRCPPCARRALDRAMPVNAPSIAAAICACITAGSSPSTKTGA